VPLLLERTAAALSGQPINESSVRRALVLLTHEISPIDDLRGSAAYKAGLLRHQLIAHLLQLYPSLSLPDLIGTGRARHEA
jgi:CO/xanthine dehydrogenase FAD-binding subunit